MNLFETFLELEIPKTEKGNVFNATSLSNFSFAKIAINNDGYPVILISSVTDGSHLFKKNTRLTYIELSHNVECILPENSKLLRFSVIIFKSTERHLQSYFLEIAELLLTKLSAKTTQKELLIAFNSFVEIFRALSQPPTKTIQGLWSELFVIENSSNPKVLVNYWHNVPEEKFDFNAGLERVEVKSSSNFERKHIFSAEQLNPPPDSRVLIASVFLKQHNSGHNIQQLIENIIEKLDSDIEIIDKLTSIVFRTLGNSVEHSFAVKFDYEIAKQSLKFYDTLNIKKIEKINIPTGVSEVKFSSDLSNVEPIILKNLREKKLLFKSL